MLRNLRDAKHQQLQLLRDACSPASRPASLDRLRRGLLRHLCLAEAWLPSRPATKTTLMNMACNNDKVSVCFALALIPQTGLSVSNPNLISPFAAASRRLTGEDSRRTSSARKSAVSACLQQLAQCMPCSCACPSSDYCSQTWVGTTCSSCEALLP